MSAAVAGVLTVVLMLATPWVLPGCWPPLAAPIKPVRNAQTSRDLVPVLRDTGLAMLVWSGGCRGCLAIQRLILGVAPGDLEGSGRSPAVAESAKLTAPQGRVAAHCSVTFPPWIIATRLARSG